MGSALGAKVNSNSSLLDPLLRPVEDKLVSGFNNGGKQKLNEIADVATFGKASDAALLQELNDRFGQDNLELKGKSISAPSRFSNAAAVISRAITGVSLSATAVNFAPCLISISPSFATSGFEFINVQPQIIATKFRFATFNAQGFNLQVRFFHLSLSLACARERERERMRGRGRAAAAAAGATAAAAAAVAVACARTLAFSPVSTPSTASFSPF